MAYDEKMVVRIRAVLAYLPKIEEKKMFGGLAFMVDGKMCITVGAERIMCRIDPAVHQEALLRKGVSTVIMRGNQYTGYVHVSLEAIKLKKDLDYWIQLSLDFNSRAKSSRKKNGAEK